MSDAIGRAEFVVFYGHGEVDQWIALPSFTSTGFKTSPVVPLVTVKTLHILDGRMIYAGCCHSRLTMGPAYLSAYGNAGFIGYDKAFGFEIENHAYFKDIVNQSVVKFVGGTRKATIHNDLRTEWDGLRHDFMAGKLSARPNAFAAGQWAERNRDGIGHN